jgi:hypothetical protein
MFCILRRLFLPLLDEEVLDRRSSMTDLLIWK